MPASPWFETDRAQKLAAGVICGLLLVGAVMLSWAVTGSPLRTLIPGTSKARVAPPRRASPSEIPLRWAALGELAIKVPAGWRRVEAMPDYLRADQTGVLQDPRRPQRWLSITRMRSDLTLPDKGSNEVRLHQAISISGTDQYLVILHDHLSSPSEAEAANKAYRALFNRIVQSAQSTQQK